MHTKQTYVDLAQTSDEIFNDYEINIEKINHILTDGNVVDAAVQDDEEEEGEMNEPAAPTTSSEPNQSSATSFGASNEVIIQPFMQTETGELFPSEILEFDVEQSVETDDYFGVHIPNQQSRLKLPPQRHLFSHHLNLASQDFEKQLSNTADKAFKQTYNKLHALWNTTNRSSYAKKICQNELGCLLKVPCETRWNSKFDAIKKVFQICKIDANYERNKINNLIRRLRVELKSTNHLSILEQTDIFVMENYIEVMEPASCALDTLQGEYICS